MDWKETYKNKIVTAEQAVSHVQSGDKIIFGDWIGEPPALVRALCARAPELEGVEIIHGMSPGPHEYMAEGMESHFHHTSLFIGPKTRKPYAEGKVDYIGGTPFHKWPDMFAKSPTLNPHWAFIQVSVPDENGMCSFGTACCFTEPAARTAKRIVAQVNEVMPVLGGKKISLDQIDYIVPFNEPIYTIGKAPQDPITTKIAENAAALIEDGATLQLGIGSLPDTIASLLQDRRDLGVHSETLTESLKALIECGALTNARKTLHPGVCIGAQAAGSMDFFRFIDRNPMFEVWPVDYVNDPYVVGQNYHMTSVNACLEVDLLGQANSETLNGRQYSGIGGQLDHVRGSQLSEGGKSILALPSTAKNGEISRIVPFFKPGTVTTVSRYDINYVVTEYGAVDLKYKTVKERAQLLISIAHPKFRDELTFKAKEMGLFL